MSPGCCFKVLEVPGVRDWSREVVLAWLVFKVFDVCVVTRIWERLVLVDRARDYEASKS